MTSGDVYSDYQSYGYIPGIDGGYSSAATMLSSLAANVAGIRAGGSSEPARELPALTVDSVKKRLNDRWGIIYSLCTQILYSLELR